MDRIVFLDRETLAPRIELRRPRFAHELIEHARTSPEQVVERLRGASIAITNKVALREAQLRQLPGLRLIAVAATGTDCIDKAWCAAHAIPVCNIRGYAVHTVPEHTFALILALRRGLVPYRRDVLAGRWQQAGQFCLFDHPIADLAGTRLGIVGRGELGRKVAVLGRAFGMDVVFAARKGASEPVSGCVPWEEFLATSDVISLHAPLTPQTRGLIAMAEFRAMRRRPLLINTARGGLVDEADLAAALDAGLIAGAGFDVSVAEPPAADSPLSRLAARDNVILTPHVAWASDQAQQALADQLIGNLEDFVAGRPIHRAEATA